MDTGKIIEYARQLKDAHGRNAIVEAGRKAADFEAQSDAENATIWRKVEAALQEMQGPHES